MSTKNTKQAPKVTKTTTATAKPVAPKVTKSTVTKQTPSKNVVSKTATATPKKNTAQAPKQPKKTASSKASSKQETVDENDENTLEENGGDDNAETAAPKTVKTRKNPMTTQLMNSIIPETKLVSKAHQEAMLASFTKLYNRKGLSGFLLEDAHNVDETRITVNRTLEAMKVVFDLITCGLSGQPLVTTKKPRKRKSTAAEADAANDEDEKAQLDDANNTIQVEVKTDVDENGEEYHYIDGENEGERIQTDEQGNPLGSDTMEVEVKTDVDENGEEYHYIDGENEGERIVTDDQGNVLTEEPEVQPPPKKQQKQANGAHKKIIIFKKGRGSCSFFLMVIYSNIYYLEKKKK